MIKKELQIDSIIETRIKSQQSSPPAISFKEWLSRIAQSKAHDEYAEQTALFHQALQDRPDSFALWMKYFAHVMEGVGRGETTLAEHMCRVEQGLAIFQQFPGMWIAVANVCLSAGEFFTARKAFEKAFERFPTKQHTFLWGKYCDAVKSNEFLPADMRIYVFQRATAHCAKYSKLLWAEHMKQGNITNAFCVLVDHASCIGQDPLDFLSKYSSDDLDPDTVVGYLQHEKNRSTGDSERLSSIYVGVANFLIRSKLHTAARDLFHSELRSCDYDFYPLLFEKYINFQHSDLASTPSEALIDAYEKFASEQPTLRTLSILRKYPDNICFLQRWLKTLEKDTSRCIEEFQRALLATKKTPHCEILWIRFAYWYEIRDEISSARHVYETGLVEVEFCSNGAFVTFIQQYVEFLLRQSEWKNAIRLLRHLTATNADAVSALTSNLSIVQQSWKYKPVWELYIGVCRRHSTPDSTALVYDRMIQLGLAGEVDILTYAQYLVEHRDLFGDKVARVLGAAVRTFPHSLELWHRYIIHSVDGRLPIRRAGQLAQQFLTSQGIDFLKLDLLSPCSLAESSALFPVTKLLEKYDTHRLLCLRNLMGVFVHALERDSHACAQIYVAFLRLDLAVGLLSGFDEIARQACESILRECVLFLRKNTYEGQIEDVLQRLRDDVTEVFASSPENITTESHNVSAEVFNFIAGLARLQRNEACAQLRFSSARQALSSTADWIPRLKTFQKSDQFWMVWMEFEELHGSQSTVLDMYKAWSSIMEVK
ncbi:pre-mRNA-splicing factor SYF1 [Perkinsela sp. CCAP 1560/4]|nr:pre-mRNA-splicing factor SYF1 [Perkinsela sp. CCAP 1560/4]|eukprot:KNH04893.1 pre-mRNA-splicing factor SYF1 [Perkinsela sp. CCAP 1560/4]